MKNTSIDSRRSVLAVTFTLTLGFVFGMEFFPIDWALAALSVDDGSGSFYVSATDSNEQTLISFVSPKRADHFFAGEDLPIVLEHAIEESKILNMFLSYQKPCGNSQCETFINEAPRVFRRYTWMVNQRLYGTTIKLRLNMSYRDERGFVQVAVAESEPFTVEQRASLTVTQPTGGVYSTGDVVPVAYVYANQHNVDFTNFETYALYRGDALIEPSISVSGDHTWWITKVYEPGDDYRIKVAVGGTEASSSFFAIRATELPVVNILSPASGIIFKIGQSYNVSWTLGASKTYQYVDIWLDVGEESDGSRRVLPITPFQFDALQFNAVQNPNRGEYVWRVPSSIDVATASFNTRQAFSYIIRLVNPAKNEFRTTAIPAATEVKNGVTMVQLAPPYVITPGKYRIYVILRNLGEVVSPYAVSDYFSIFRTTEPTDQPVTPEAGQPDFVAREQRLVTSRDRNLVSRLKGYILLQTEERGEAWYLDGATEKKYYLKDGATAYAALRKFGLGITNADLAEIPVGVEPRFADTDSDHDGLPDKLEEAISTDASVPDSDGDGHYDGVEVSNGHNPLGPGLLPMNRKLVSRLLGKILLQVEAHGQAWYVNPRDGKRYYLKDGDAAYQFMRFLSLGITNANLRKINVGNIK